MPASASSESTMPVKCDRVSCAHPQGSGVRGLASGLAAWGVESASHSRHGGQSQEGYRRTSPSNPVYAASKALPASAWSASCMPPLIKWLSVSLSMCPSGTGRMSTGFVVW